MQISWFGFAPQQGLGLGLDLEGWRIHCFRKIVGYFSKDPRFCPWDANRNSPFRGHNSNFRHWPRSVEVRPTALESQLEYIALPCLSRGTEFHFLHEGLGWGMHWKLTCPWPLQGVDSFLTSFLSRVSAWWDNSEGMLGCTFLSPVQVLPPLERPVARQD